MAHYFITRPVAAIVLALLIVIGGLLALTTLPISQYPDVVPPQVVITATYPGQNAEKVAAEVAQPIEEQVNGVENMLYMESQCTNDGGMRLTVTFKVGTDPDMAQVLVQNRVAIATPRLPDVVKQIGVITKKQSTAILLVVTLISEDDPKTGKPLKDQLTLSNYGRINVKDDLARVQGVGDVFIFGEREYSIRVWLDPAKMNDFSLSVDDVTRAVAQQNLSVASGQIGAPPAPRGQNFQFVVTADGRLPDAAAFEAIVVKSSGEQIVRLRDVVRDARVVDGVREGGVELGARSYDTFAMSDGKPAVAFPVFQLPGANALDTARAVRKKMEDLKPELTRQGIKYDVVFNPTTFIQDSVAAVVQTLFEAVALVALVVLVFIQNWRAALIPMLAIPVALIGTLAAMYAFGYSINNLTLFGLVLAIGIVVDDAIVVVEAVEVHIAAGLSPQAATEKAMHEVSGAIIGVSLVLASVFLPAAVIPGITGLFFKQFAVTVAVSTLLSAVNSLTLSPALCPILLKPHGAKPDPVQRVLNVTLGWFFRLFNRGFEWASNVFGAAVARLIRVSLVVLLAYVALLGLTGYGFSRVPGGFIPQQDQGYMVINIELPEGASLERTQKVVDQVHDILLGPVGPDGKRDASKGQPGLYHTLGVTGYSVLSSANLSNTAGIYSSFLPHEERKGWSADAIVAALNKKFAGIQEASVTAFGAPPILGLGNAGGFKLQIRDNPNYGLGPLEGAAQNVSLAAMREPGIPVAFSTFRSAAPQYRVLIDRERCYKMGISDKSVKDALQVYLGSLYVNDVTLENRNWQVNVMADATSRARKEDIGAIKVRTADGGMASLASVVNVAEVSGPTKVNRYNMVTAADVNGFTVPSVISSGEATAKVEVIAKRELPDGMSYEWTDMAYQQQLAASTVVRIPGVFEFVGDTTLLVFGLSTLLAFLVLAFLYESFLLPLAVVLIVPMCLLFAVAGILIANLDLNVFTQIGLVVLVGLACKNAILIVEFAKQKRAEGAERWDAAVAAAKQRLRPILMTSFAFIFGVLPLVTAEGAGAEMRRALGTAVFSGMIGVTVFGLFFTPVFYTVLERLRGTRASFSQSQGTPASTQAKEATETQGDIVVN
ncbi:efflux RND transporter permease subunit [Limnoglobus roseus]|uniref:AcrB/AcrD/AcrF family protein n=1 Tax=Limnoglobus roseus TaxID=2598579 RepID=A0A5C1ARS5_9BACT|nr:efflux RND transporter permease subunit [Limnoglobus roseus]QEL20793.1 AcrB/AcrD/AcrF family protein [Limnoglobus roseus]